MEAGIIPDVITTVALDPNRTMYIEYDHTAIDSGNLLSTQMVYCYLYPYKSRYCNMTCTAKFKDAISILQGPTLNTCTT